jgi:hypothetical protein
MHTCVSVQSQQARIYSEDHWWYSDALDELTYLQERALETLEWTQNSQVYTRTRLQDLALELRFAGIVSILVFWRSAMHVYVKRFSYAQRTHSHEVNLRPIWQEH